MHSRCNGAAFFSIVSVGSLLSSTNRVEKLCRIPRASLTLKVAHILSSSLSSVAERESECLRFRHSPKIVLVCDTDVSVSVDDQNRQAPRVD